MNDLLLEARGLGVHFPVAEGPPWRRQTATVRAVDDVDLAVRRGQCLALVGESGCGKSTTGRALLHLSRPTAGEVLFDGAPLSALWRRRRGRWQQLPAWRALRRRMQMVFQDPFASLDPRMTVEQIVGEPLRAFGAAPGAALRRQVQGLLEEVGISPEHVRRYPHAFSGGQRQRLGIARALALRPELIVADEPIAALDVSVQAQVLTLLGDLQARHGLTYVFISHDLAAVRHLADAIAVMYLGRVVERAAADACVARPAHPYTQALLAAVPLPVPALARARRQQAPRLLEGDVPSPTAPPPGCAFAPRCPQRIDRCTAERPRLRELAPDHWVACHVACTPAPPETPPRPP